MSSRVVHGVNGRNDGRMSIPWSREDVDCERRVGSGVTLVETLEGAVVDRLERRHHEDASRRRELAPHTAMAQDVLDLHGAVEREMRELVVHGRDHSARVPGDVQEVGVTEGDVRRARLHELCDVVEHCAFVRDPHPAVVDDRDRAVTAAVRAPAGRLDGPDEAPSGALGELHVAVQRGENVARRAREERGGPARPSSIVTPVLRSSTQSTSARSYSPAMTRSATSAHMCA